jgi:hypothetical protein
MKYDDRPRSDRLRDNKGSVFGSIAVAASGIAAIGALMWMGTPSSHGAELVTSPWAATCIAAHRHAEGATADQCRQAGWTVRPRLVVGPHGVVRYHTMPSCTYEDASDNVPCSWNIRAGDGNGRGLAFWAGANNHGHYVWPTSPVRPPFHWVSSGLADALAEGPNPAWARHWEQCVTRGTTHRVVICPDGYRERS